MIRSGAFREINIQRQKCEPACAALRLRRAAMEGENLRRLPLSMRRANLARLIAGLIDRLCWNNFVIACAKR